MKAVYKIICWVVLNNETLATETAENHDDIEKAFFQGQAFTSLLTEELPYMQRGLRFRAPSMTEGFSATYFFGAVLILQPPHPALRIK